MLCQVLELPTKASSVSVQVAPELVEVQMFPLYTTAASLVPSLEEVIPYQLRALSLEVQLAPESVDVQIFPPLITAASLVPSLEEEMLCQAFSSAHHHTASQLSPESFEVQSIP